MVRIILLTLFMVQPVFAQVSKPSPDFSYSVDVWVAKDLDYGTFSIMVNNTGEPVAANSISLRLSCHDSDSVTQPYHQLMSELLVCDFTGYSYNKARSMLTVQYKPIVNGTCGALESKEFSMRSKCGLYREPNSQKKK